MGSRARGPEKQESRSIMARLKDRYISEIRPQLVEKFKYKNPLAAPRLEKVVINAGVGKAIQDSKLMDQAVEELGRITGQRPQVTKARRAIAAFRLRVGLPIGCRVTLRGVRMYEFVDRLLNVALPRIRDFRGVPLKSFDGTGNYTLGVREQVMFPEVSLDKVDSVIGMNITLVTTARTDEEAQEFLRLMGMPFRSSES